MSKQLIYLVSFIFTLMLIMISAGNAAEANLVGWWKLDETTGTIAHDASGNGNNGTIKGDPIWVVGYIDGALQLDGDGDYVDIGSVGISGAAQRTIAGWVRASTTSIPGWTCVFGFAPDGDIAATYFDIEVDDAGIYTTNVGGGYSYPSIAVDTEWHHFAATYNGSAGSSYVDGELNTTSEGELGTIDRFRIGARFEDNNYFPGIVDDVRVYNKALSLEEIQKLTAGPKAYNPIPADNAIYTDIWASLGWSLGNTAVSHDVYFSNNFDDVNNSSNDAFLGNQTLLYYLVGTPGSPYPDGLVPGTTYYWRIDEVEADNVTKHRGDIWSFRIPSQIAYNPDPPDGAQFVDPDVVLSWTPGFNAKLHTVYFGDNFDDVNDATGASPRGLPTHTPGPLELEKVYYWRIDEFDGDATYKGDVWSFTTPGAIGNPQPSNAAMDIGINATLAWAPSNHAATHQIYFGSDKDAVRKADISSAEYKGQKILGVESYDPGLLERDTIYYWRIDEVNESDPNSPWKGPLWSFTTGAFLIVDDFENYNTSDNQIWRAWKDGLGYAAYDNEPAYPGNGTGSAVGDETVPSYMEETIVHGGRQSMPLFYDNNKEGYSKYSEAELTLSHPRDWTEKDPNVLSLWFRGNSSNTPERMYVAISNSTGAPAVVYHDDTEAAKTATWTEWIIPLQTFADQGIILTNVDSIAIGLGTRGNLTIPGGSGKIYIDDIRLY